MAYYTIVNRYFKFYIIVREKLGTSYRRQTPVRRASGRLNLKVKLKN